MSGELSQEEILEAENWMESVEEAYSSVGDSGTFVLNFVLFPCKLKWKNGDRSRHLYDEIMAIDI